jgi:hypothetical protein
VGGRQWAVGVEAVVFIFYFRLMLMPPLISLRDIMS